MGDDKMATVAVRGDDIRIGDYLEERRVIAIQPSHMYPGHALLIKTAWGWSGRLQTIYKCGMYEVRRG